MRSLRKLSAWRHGRVDSVSQRLVRLVWHSWSVKLLRRIGILRRISRQRPAICVHWRRGALLELLLALFRALIEGDLLSCRANNKSETVMFALLTRSEILNSPAAAHARPTILLKGSVCFLLIMLLRLPLHSVLEFLSAKVAPSSKSKMIKAPSDPKYYVTYITEPALFDYKGYIVFMKRQYFRRFVSDVKHLRVMLKMRSNNPTRKAWTVRVAEILTHKRGYGYCRLSLRTHHNKILLVYFYEDFTDPTLRKTPKPMHRERK